METGDILEIISRLDQRDLRFWIRQLLAYSVADPVTPEPRDDAPYLHLLELVHFDTARLDRQIQLCQMAITDETCKLCAEYHPDTHGAHLGLQLINFFKEMPLEVAAQSFARHLRNRSFNKPDISYVDLWVEALWFVGENIHDWSRIAPIFEADANGLNVCLGEQPVNPRVQLTALDAWSEYGPTTTLPAWGLILRKSVVTLGQNSTYLRRLVESTARIHLRPSYVEQPALVQLLRFDESVSGLPVVQKFVKQLVASTSTPLTGFEAAEIVMNRIAYREAV